MSIRRHTASIILCALAQAWGLPALAQSEQRPPAPPSAAAPHAGPEEGRPGGFPHPGLERLGLSEEQQDKIFAILHAQAPAERSQGKAAQKAREALFTLGRSDATDAQRLRVAADALGKALAEQALLRTNTQLQIRAVLSPEQRTRLEEEAPPHQPPAPFEFSPGKPAPNAPKARP
ncbi:MAG: hypothetical protein CGU28_09490 [Candidatus Dactylopiibacterium carminicum]|uniref:Periplasmic heavy metal sensor n=1 Tax=Candidatus Dactylopiibacterium carminicum TaxID=857335 RepID=A0A272ERR9_9RHOO|nr:Spy/CpxP family protein refolding chaperone [Candidatus Dactylopiibacterium carminicum]KAF7598892.1 hypothetical protein BGI27_10850 [Candidatus Dactylopiibacterium carminicum]PAS92809.1 MAG: hypothetical protein CGU29_10080 [Candidatus Dactylopiibacterium carminicum]PAS96261.1 MAG: hypothetical protein CGU28_09490 [Candidatus Dactylopiibacterium carminicum]PAS98910.1 MAG: hypothetical protein BSR46_10870 [Candidatus Dactylopiibacterium carminicum]